MTMHIQHRLENQGYVVPPLVVGIGVAALIGGVAWWAMRAKESEEEADTSPDVEIIPPANWNTDPNSGGLLNSLYSGQRYTAVMTGPLGPNGEPADYEVSYIPGEAFDVHDVKFGVARDQEGNPMATEVKITFTPKRTTEDLTPALIRAEVPGAPQTWRQLHIEIE